MRRLGFAPLLLLILAWSPPASAAGPSTDLIFRDLPRVCLRAIRPEGQAATTPRCLGGIVLAVSPLGMKVNLPKGPDLKVVFSEKTTFVTASAAASLVGLVPGDFACAEGTLRNHVLTAAEVLFDTDAFPCGPLRKQLHKG